MRGEHRHAFSCAVALRGSSPHARGTLTQQQLAEKLGGIIPACAGNTLLPKSGLYVARDHPRMRGEHASAASCW